MGNSEAYNRHYDELDLIEGAPHRFDNPAYVASIKAICAKAEAESKARKGSKR